MRSTSDWALELTQVGFVRQGTDILQAIDWRLPIGAHAAVLGPNGAGKSTLIRLLTGYLYPTAGQATILGQTLGHADVHALRRHIGLVDPANPCLPTERMSALELVLTGFFGHYCLDFDEPTPAQRALGEQALRQVGLAHHADQLFATLSMGEQRRALLARALAPAPRLIILDEPTAGLDLLARETMLATIDQLALTQPTVTTIIVTHHLEELLPRTSEVLLLGGGKVAATGPPTRVLTDAAISSVFGCPVRVTHAAGRWSWMVEPQLWSNLVQPTETS